MLSTFEHETERAAFIALGEAQFWHDMHDEPAPRPPATAEERIAEYEEHRHPRLLDRVHELQLQVNPDYCRSDGCIM